MNSRMDTLLKMLGESNKFVYKNSIITDINKKPADFTSANEKLKINVDKSRMLLNKALIS